MCLHALESVGMHLLLGMGWEGCSNESKRANNTGDGSNYSTKSFTRVKSTGVHRKITKIF